MKTSSITALILAVTIVGTIRAQDNITAIHFRLESDGTPKNEASLEGLKLPLHLLFTAAFNGKTIELTKKDGTAWMREYQFGSPDLSLESDGIFRFVIGENKETSPGDNLIDLNNTMLLVDGTEFELDFSNTSPLLTVAAEQTAAAGRYLYYDALTLASPTASGGEKTEILKDYGINLQVINANPFLNKLFEAELLENTNLPQGLDTGISLPFNIGNADVTYFAAGIARFLAERAKDELNEAFFRKMQEQLKAYPELARLFPKTATFLNTIQTYAYTSIIQVLKEAFETDIRNLPTGLYDLTQLNELDCGDIGDEDKLNDCKTRMGKLDTFMNRKEGHWLSLGLYALKESMESPNPAGLLRSIITSNEYQTLKGLLGKNDSFPQEYNAASAIALVDLLSQSLISKETGKIWISATEISELLKQEQVLNAYLGLMLVRLRNDYKDIKFYRGGTQQRFADLLEEIGNNWSNRKAEITALITNTHAVFRSADNAITKMTMATSQAEEVDPQALYNYFTTFTSSLKTVVRSPLLKSIAGDETYSTYLRVEQFLAPAADIAYHLTTKKYSAAIYDAVLLLNRTDHKLLDEKAAKALTKYGTFIASVASAQSSDEVKQAIEASVLPAGSSAVKRNSSWSIALNAYVGPYWGQAHTADTISKETRTFGLIAPIGLSVSKGLGAGWGVSLHLQVIDVGALTNFYLREGDDVALPENFKVRLADIVAPGAQFAVNIPKTPISIMYGVQYVPALTRVGQINSDTNNLSPIAWRSQLAVAVDIPLFHLKVWDFK